jgi:hypothetical protein
MRRKHKGLGFPVLFYLPPNLTFINLFAILLVYENHNQFQFIVELANHLEAVRFSFDLKNLSMNNKNRQIGGFFELLIFLTQ